jgi:hypothetical protein
LLKVRLSDGTKLSLRHDYLVDPPQMMCSLPVNYHQNAKYVYLNPHQNGL